MLFLYLLTLGSCLALLAAGVVERRNHDAALNSIPVRVLVNGIRGKSSITRLCAGALRGGGPVTTAKTTGSAARFIHPDGTEEPIYRRFGVANVIEQVTVVRQAAAYQPDVFVAECMAVAPDLQEFNQTTLIRSTIGVLCNVREDHLEEMGPTLDDVARSLARAMPVGGVCVTAEKQRYAIIQREADRRRCRLVHADPDSVTDEEMAPFPTINFRDNVAIALVVADLLGIDRPAALAGMWEAPPDPGALRVDSYLAGQQVLRVANVFAANDPESTVANIAMLDGQGAILRPLHLVINCRPDRIARNAQMGALVAELAPDRVILMGEPTRSARSAIPSDWRGPVTDLGGHRRPEELVSAILADVDQEASLVLVGNIHGQGEALLAQLRTLPEHREPGRVPS